MGGIMAQAVQAGSRVACITATRGEMGSLDERRWPPASMAAVRERELVEALAVLGVTELHWLDYVDGSLREAAEDEAIAKISALLEEIQPDSILTFGPDGMTGHSDHKVVSRWTTRAFERAQVARARLHYATKTPEWVAEASEHPDVRGVFDPGLPPVTPRAELSIDFECPPDLLDRKLDALARHASQIYVLAGLLGRQLWRRFNAGEYFRPAA